jgi:hypothetical protein
VSCLHCSVSNQRLKNPSWSITTDLPSSGPLSLAKLPTLGLLARNNLRLAGHPGQKDPRGYLWPTDITNSLVSENSVIDQFGESNRSDMLLPRGLENRFQEAAVFI